MTSPIECRLDLVPAALSIMDEGGVETDTFSKTRVIITAERIYAWQDAVGGTVELVLDARIEDLTGRNTTGWVVTLADGRSARVIRTGACNCGSRLKSFRPFTQGLVQGAWPQD